MTLEPIGIVVNSRPALRTAVLTALLVAVGSGAAPRPARAYTVSSPVSTGCHERITSDALRAVRLELATAAPMPAGRNDRALVADLQFTPDDDMRDLGAASLLIGVRDNDLKGRNSTDLTQLALVHGDPKAQREHCLRSEAEDDPGGSQAALTECRAYILEKVQTALGGLDAGGTPDPTKLTSLPLYLALRHRVDALLPTYYVRMGQAIHAMEDGFTHTYRTPDGTKVTVVLNWIDEVNGGRIEARDGPAHASDLDNCGDLDDLRKRRRELATEAAAAMLRTTLDPQKSNAEKMKAMEDILDANLSDSPGCTFDDDWCDAAERTYGSSTTSGCAMAGRGGGSSASAWGVVIAACGLWRGLRRRSRRRPAAARAGLASLLLGVLLVGNAFARQTEPAATPPPPEGAAAEPDKHVPPPPVTTPVAEPGPKDPSQTALGAYLGGSGAVSNGALAAAGGVRLRFSKSWSFGLDAEWNPFITFNGTQVRAGVFNAYGTAILRLPLAYEQFNLRTTLNLGASRILMDLYGVPNGSTGLYGGISPLGLEWKLSRSFFMIINPLNLAVPIPRLTGVPYSYPQYRFTIGFEVYAG